MGDDRVPDRLKDLGERLAKARRPAEDRNRGFDGGKSMSMSGFGMAFRIGAELVAALIVGVGIGLLLDKWLETGPLFLVVFFFLGAAAGVVNVYRAASSLGGGAQDAGDPHDKSKGGPSV